MTQSVASLGANADVMEAALSLERFGRYVVWAEGERARAVELYTLNTRVSEALYVSLQALEIALRNRMHTVMSEAHGTAWFLPEAELLSPRQYEQVAAVTAELVAENKPVEDGRIVAGLTFSFWTAMFGRGHDDLWKRTLHRIATRDGRYLRRKDFASPLTKVRMLRNRIAHHEPILYWNLPDHHRVIREMTSWLSPALNDWRSSIDRFSDVHPEERLQLARPPKSDV